MVFPFGVEWFAHEPLELLDGPGFAPTGKEILAQALEPPLRFRVRDPLGPELPLQPFPRVEARGVDPSSATDDTVDLTRVADVRERIRVESGTGSCYVESGIRGGSPRGRALWR